MRAGVAVHATSSAADQRHGEGLAIYHLIDLGAQIRVEGDLDVNGVVDLCLSVDCYRCRSGRLLRLWRQRQPLRLLLTRRQCRLHWRRWWEIGVRSGRWASWIAPDRNMGDWERARWRRRRPGRPNPLARMHQPSELFLDKIEPAFRAVLAEHKPI